jgi:hypothetical protein
MIFSPFNHVPKVYACLKRVRKHFYLREHNHGYIGHNLQEAFLGDSPDKGKKLPL